MLASHGLHAMRCLANTLQLTAPNIPEKQSYLWTRKLLNVLCFAGAQPHEYSKAYHGKGQDGLCAGHMRLHVSVTHNFFHLELCTDCAGSYHSNDSVSLVHSGG